MLRPKRLTPLKSGDKLGLFAPASPFEKKKFLQAIDNIEKIGLSTRYGKGLFSSQGYLAGSDQRRAKELATLFKDPKVKAIMAVRGGYGCSRLLPYLDAKVFKNNPKLLVGYSDLTILQLYLWNHFKIPSLHGAMLVPNFSGKVSKAYLKKFEQTLKGEAGEQTVAIKSSQVIRSGKSSGILMGGCLSLIVNSIGTSAEINTKGCILFFEDLAEPPYRVDRMLTHLKNAGKLKGLKGIVIGSYVGTGWEGAKAKKFFTHFFQGFKCPIIYGLNIGHMDNPLLLPMGAKVTLDTQKRKLILGDIFL